MLKINHFKKMTVNLDFLFLFLSKMTIIYKWMKYFLRESNRIYDLLIPFVVS
jgi:hypothetical protein